MQNIVQWKWLLNHLLIQQIVFTYGRSVHFVVNEEVAKGTTVGSLLDHVSGSFSNLKFVKLSSNDDASNLFTVDQFTGEISVASRLDRERLCKTTITHSTQFVYAPTYRSSGDSRIAENVTENICQVQFNVNCLSTTTTGFYQGFSGGKLILLFDIFITIRDINDNGCSFIPSDTQTIEIREDSAVIGTRVLLHSPFDPDDISLGHSVHMNSIKFHPASKEFSRKASVFFTTETEFNQLFRLHIYPSNFTSAETSESPIPFRLELELLSSLDFEQQQNYSFSILADDNLGVESHKCKLNVILLVKDCNDNEPVFKQRLYETDVSENTPAESLVVHVTATDADSGMNGAINYRMLEASQETRKFFYLNPITGELRVRQRLNHRQKAVHEFRVVAENLPNSTRPESASELSDLSSTLVRLHVIDVNDHAPVIRLFSPTGSPQLEVMEESPPGQDVAVVDVTDNDSGDNALVECKLQNQSVTDALRLSSMDELVGVPLSNYYKKRYKITVEIEIDREVQSEVHFLIRCSDNGTNRLTTDHSGVINVIDVNDNPPVFKNSEYSVSVSEDIDPNRAAQRFKLTLVEATDADTGMNAKLRYSLDHGTPSNLLKLVKIDPTSGILSSTGNLDREQLERFSVSIVVTDMGDPPKAAHTRVNIRVVDYNDHSPTFSKSSYKFSLIENSPIDQLVGVLTVSDADIGVNSQITISLEDATDQPRLYGSQPGTIDQMVNFKKSSQNKNLTSVTDHHSITTDIAQLRLVSYRLRTVQHDKIQNGSVYEIQLYTKSIWDREAILSRFKNYLPASGNFKESQKQLLPGVQATPFPSNRCVVAVQVLAEDHGNPRLTKRVSVNIEVEDENDNPPVFKVPDTTVINNTRVTVSYKEPKGFVLIQVSGNRQ
ncbi:protocadherin delta 1 [Paragonimus westermani]|uniref:Protocadherin delta 1 n=1 Tax=Paragonimus westermani TaxID=34504 RepID=A0A5J4N8Z9_9TREM|nr:protocadherin delta 1 [Paragonimus westermani]